VRNIRVFIRFINYYCCFIKGFSKIALLLTKLIQKGLEAAKGSYAQRREESQGINLGKEGKQAF
jgi:hypothetical protein